MTNQTPNKSTAILLAIVFGAFGAHQFYLRKYNVAILWLIIFLFTAITGVMPLILGGIGVIQGIQYMFYKPEDWERIYGSN